MKDLREIQLTPMKGKYIKAGYEINEDSVKQMFTFLGVKHDDTLIQEAIGYFYSNSIEITMSNLASYLESKQIITTVDNRKKN